MGDDSVPLARSTVLRLRGLPFQATEGDIEQFFVGYKLTQCIICKRNGRATGEAYVQLETEALAGRAMHELNCKYVGRRYIEIFEALDTDITSNAVYEMKGIAGYVLRLRGLPYSATRGDVEMFFEGLDICKGEESVVFSVTSQGKPTGEAYVEFMSEQCQQEAMKKHKEHMGSRYIELFKSTKADLLQALQQNRFYQEQAERRLQLSQTVIGLPSVLDSSQQQRLRMQRGYDFQVEEVSHVLKGLSMHERSPLALSPTAPPFMSSSYDRGQNFRVAPPPPPPQQYVTHPSSYVNSHQYFIPDQSLNRSGGLSGQPYLQSSQMYDVHHPHPHPHHLPHQTRQRLPQQGQMRSPDVMVRHQGGGSYMMRPPVMRQPRQMVSRYPSREAWMYDCPQGLLSSMDNPEAIGFHSSYVGALQTGTMVASPSGSIQTPYPIPIGSQHALPEMLDGGEVFEFGDGDGDSGGGSGDMRSALTSRKSQ